MKRKQQGKFKSTSEIRDFPLKSEENCTQFATFRKPLHTIPGDQKMQRCGHLGPMPWPHQAQCTDLSPHIFAHQVRFCTEQDFAVERNVRLVWAAHQRKPRVVMCRCMKVPFWPGLLVLSGSPWTSTTRRRGRFSSLICGWSDPSPWVVFHCVPRSARRASKPT